MASKLLRVFQNVFMLNGSSAHCEQFGSKVAGAPLPTLDPASIQALGAFINQGWSDAVFGANKQPFLEDMNGLFRLIFYQIAYMMQQGIPEWDPSTSYFTGSIVLAPGTSQQYGSLVDNNQGNALPSQANNAFWQYLNPQADPPGIIKAYGLTMATPTSVPGYLLCDGGAYANAVYPNLGPNVPSVWRTFNGAADPGAGNFRTPDLRGLTLMGVGQGAGFSLRTLGQLVGEESHVLVTGEMPSHGHSVNDPSHAHTERQGTAGGPINGTPTNSLWDGSSTIVGAIATVAAATGITLNNTGGGGAHNNMQPSAGANWIIKT